MPVGQGDKGVFSFALEASTRQQVMVHGSQRGCDRLVFRPSEFDQVTAS
jgi:hypothetical protein